MKKTKINSLLDLCLWIINPFLIVLVIFDAKIEPGLFFQWLGKLHPLGLHFPIVFGVLIAIYLLFFSKQRLEPETEKMALAVNALSASIVALFGIFLAKQGSYEGAAFDLHRWGGFAIALLSWLLYFSVNFKMYFQKSIVMLYVIVLIVGTHKGAQLTHGVNALSFPKKESPENEADESGETSSIYLAAVAPVFAEKCISCHGPDKSKGGLRLDTKEFILRGGESGSLFDVNASGSPLLLELIHLPLEDEAHMPPDGKAQLSELEIAMLQNWVSKEKKFEIALNELETGDEMIPLVKEYIALNKEIEIKTDLPDLEEYNTNYCAVNYLYYGSDRIEVNFFQGSFYKRASLNKLLAVKENVVKLNMQNMPLTKEDVDIILSFENLEKINLNSTGLDISEINRLKELTQLRNVAICGIQFNKNELDKLLSEATFTSINVWSDNLSKEELAEVMVKYPNIALTPGDNLEDKILKINSPVIDQDSLIIKTFLDVRLKHLLKGVEIYYTTDGSRPDSLSRKYNEPLRVSENTVLKARAYKKGWLSSDVVQKTFYRSGITPDTIFLSETPHPKYPGKGAKTLIDRSLGEANFSNGEWLGYKDYDLEFTIGFKEKQPLRRVEINSLTALGPHIFPLHSISVRGSDNGKDFEQLNFIEFPITEKGFPDQAGLFACKLPENSSFKYYRIRVSNLKKIPAWHQAKGESAWVFVDEVFFN